MFILYIYSINSLFILSRTIILYYCTLFDNGGNDELRTVVRESETVPHVEHVTAREPDR